MTAGEILHRGTLVKELGDTPLVDADEARLAQVFINLLVNAAQALPEQSDSAQEIRVVTIHRWRRPCGDRGPRYRRWHPGGPRREDLRSILHDEAGRGRHRAGPLHLPQPRERHGRRDLGDQRIGRGTIFRVVLPQTATAPRTSASVAAAAASPLASGPAPVTVLIVDDESSVGRNRAAPGVARARGHRGHRREGRARAPRVRPRLRRHPVRPDDAADVRHGFL